MPSHTLDASPDDCPECAALLADYAIPEPGLPPYSPEGAAVRVETQHAAAQDAAIARAVRAAARAYETNKNPLVFLLSVNGDRCELLVDATKAELGVKP